MAWVQLFVFLCLQLYSSALGIGCNHNDLPATNFSQSDQQYLLSRRSKNFSPIRIVYNTRFLVGISPDAIDSILELIEYAKQHILVSAALQVITMAGNLFVPLTCTSYFMSSTLAEKYHSVASTTTCWNVAQVPGKPLETKILYDLACQSQVVAGGKGVPYVDLVLYVTANNPHRILQSLNRGRERGSTRESE